MCGLWLAWSDSSLRRAGPGRIARAAAIAATAFFLDLPFVLAEPLTAWRDIRANRRIVIDRAAEIGGQAFASAPEINARMLWHDAAGWPVILLSVAGLSNAGRDEARACACWWSSFRRRS